ncbi:hypothetical protein RRG08_053567 [Elysia crispata]|uniref:Uncharacterized protein n=1 Tax=Elysia crispata TaxID=231223 RepID=A0AAE0Y282_9GAST|nr:hypothetical protein RRG08_053567 [Elysia crispata]
MLVSIPAVSAVPPALLVALGGARDGARRYRAGLSILASRNCCRSHYNNRPNGRTPGGARARVSVYLAVTSPAALKASARARSPDEFHNLT